MSIRHESESEMRIEYMSNGEIGLKGIGVLVDSIEIECIYTASPFLQSIVHVRVKVQLITHSCSDVPLLVFNILNASCLDIRYIPPPTPDEAMHVVKVVLEIFNVCVSSNVA